MIVAIRVQPSHRGGQDELVHVAEMGTMSEILGEITATARHYTKVRNRYYRVTARSSRGKVLATVGVSPDSFRG